MIDDHRIIGSIHNDLDSLRQLFGNPIDQKALTIQMLKDLQPYVPKTEHLKEATKLGIYLWEYAIFLRVKSNSMKLDFFNELYYHFSNAKQKFPDAFETSYRYYFSTKHRAIADYADHFHLERSKSLKSHNLSVKIAFQEIGQTIEGCIQPFARYFLRLIDLSRSEANPQTLSEFDSMSLGDVCITLHRQYGQDWLFAPKPWNISLSQWRNIAHHCSYRYNNETDTIICRYGRQPNIKTLELQYRDIAALCKTINEAFCFLKMADAIFSLGIPAITESLSGECFVTKDSIIGVILEILQTNSLKILAFDWETSPWKLFAIDPLSRNEADLGKILEPIGSFIPLIDNCSLMCTIRDKKTGRLHTAIIEKGRANLAGMGDKHR